MYHNDPLKRTIEPLTYRISDLAKALGLSRRSIERFRASGAFPKPDAKAGRCPLWRPETIQAWLTKGGAQ